VHLGVLLAFSCTGGADRGASLHLQSDCLHVHPSLTGKDPGRGLADVGAIEIKADTFHQHLRLFLAQTGICADVAGIGAGDALADAIRKLLHVQLGFTRVRRKHFLCFHGSSF